MEATHKVLFDSVADTIDCVCLKMVNNIKKTIDFNINYFN